MPTGKPANSFAFDGQAQGRDVAEHVVTETHSQWKRLVGKQCDPGNIAW